MAAGKANLLVEQGATLNYAVQLLDGAGANVDLTGYHAKLQARATPASAGTLLSLDDQAIGGLTLGGAAGTISILATPAQTRSIDTIGLAQNQVPAFVGLDALSQIVQATGYLAPWAMEITDAGGNVTRILEGSLVITPEVCV